MTSSVPQSATLPPPLHSPHSPYTKNRASAFGSCLDDYEEVCNRRAPQQPQQPSQQQQQHQTHFRIRSEADRTDTESSSNARWSVHSSQPTTPCAEGNTTAFARGVKSNTSTPALDTPPSLSTSKDARLACRQSREEAYAPATTETSGDSGRPQKKELRIEECVANVCTVNRAIFSPASVLSATTMSMDTACTGGRDSSIFSFASSVPDAYLAALPKARSSNNVCGGGGGGVNSRRPAPISTAAAAGTGVATPAAPPNQIISPALSINLPAPPHGGIIATLVEHSPTEHSVAGSTLTTTTAAAGMAAANEASASSSRISKCKRRLQGLNRPAFDLKAVEEAQGSFLAEEEVCNAAQCYPLSEITPLLCVGTWKDAANPTLLRRLGIKYVLNVARELDPAAEANVIAHNKDLIYESIPMSDCHSQDVGAHLRQAFQFIERARAAKSRVLVHCRRGISRSPAIVVGYLMASEHRSYEDALRFVTERRGCVSLNLAFQERLSEYVPSGEFFHGSPVAASTPGGVLPSLPSPANRAEQGGSNGSNNNNAGGGGGGSSSTNNSRAGSFRAQQSQSQQQQQPQQPQSSFTLSALHRGDDTLPPPRGPFSACSSNASSRASSNLRQSLSLTGVPSTTPNVSRPTPQRPRLAMQKKGHKKSSTTTTPVANPMQLSTSQNTSFATASATNESSCGSAVPAAASPGHKNPDNNNSSSSGANASSFAGGRRPSTTTNTNNKTSWLEEESTAPASAFHKSAFASPFLHAEPPTSWAETKASPSQQQQQQEQQKTTHIAATPLRVKATKLDTSAPPGGSRRFGDFGSGSAFDHAARSSSHDSEKSGSSRSSSRSRFSSTNPEEDEVEEPGSPFGVGNRRTFAHFNFSQPSSSSNNVSPASKRNTRSFSEEADHSSTLPHPSDPPLCTANEAAAAASADQSAFAKLVESPSSQHPPRKHKKPSWSEDEEGDSAPPHTSFPADQPRHRRPQPPPLAQPQPQRSAFDDMADDESGDADALLEVAPPHRLQDAKSLQKPAPSPFAGGRPTLLHRATSGVHDGTTATAGPAQPSATTSGGSALSPSSAAGHNNNNNNNNYNSAKVAPPVPLRSFAVAAKEPPPRAHAESPSRGEDSCGSVSPGNTTGTVGGLSSTPYLTQGSLNDDTNLSSAQVASHRSSLSG